MARRWFAFLRAINVGGHTVRMEDLRAHFEHLGFGDVATFIASGNVIFRAGGAGDRSLESRIEDHLKATLGYEVATFVRTRDELDSIAAGQPFAETDRHGEGHRLYVAFLRDAPDPATARDVQSLSTDTDSLTVRGREVYWLSRVSMRDSPISGARIEKTAGGPATVRNMNTIERLLKKYGDD